MVKIMTLKVETHILEMFMQEVEVLVDMVVGTLEVEFKMDITLEMAAAQAVVVDNQEE